jgi:hypothetical protein
MEKGNTKGKKKMKNIISFIFVFIALLYSIISVLYLNFYFDQLSKDMRLVLMGLVLIVVFEADRYAKENE